MLPLRVTAPAPFPVRVIVSVLFPVLAVASMLLAMLAMLDEFWVMVSPAPLNRSALPPRKKDEVLALKEILFSTKGLAISLLSGTPDVPVFVVPAKIKSVVVALVGAVPPQFAPLLQS